MQKTQINIHKEETLVQHNGIFKKQLSLWQAVAFIVSATVGAGVLGIPYAVAQVGLLPGMLFIVLLGSLMMGLNLFIGEVATRTKQPLQLAGLTQKYLGKSAAFVMGGIFYVSLFGAQLIYLIGEGESLATLFGGDSLYWSLGFFALSTIVILIGVQTIKTVEMLLTIGILAVVVLISAISVPHLSFEAIRYVNIAQLFIPYGVILFAFNGVSSIPEAHHLLQDNNKDFKKAVIYSGLINIVLYSVFAFAVVGVTGLETTQIATIGLGEAIGPLMITFGNIFAILAMGTSYILIALALKHSLLWDLKISPKTATLLVLGFPMILFLLGLRQFITVMDVVGGVFISIQAIFIVLLYLKAKNNADLPQNAFHVQASLWLGMIILIGCTIGGVYSIVSKF